MPVSFSYVGSRTTNPYNYRRSFPGKLATDAPVVIESVKFSLNQVDLDGLGDHTSGWIYDYLKLFYLQGFESTQFGNHLTREKFLGGEFVAIYDFTTNFNASNVSHSSILLLLLNKSLKVLICYFRFSPTP